MYKNNKNKIEKLCFFFFFCVENLDKRSMLLFFTRNSLDLCV
jgi:hypothetical protein